MATKLVCFSLGRCFKGIKMPGPNHLSFLTGCLLFVVFQAECSSINAVGAFASFFAAALYNWEEKASDFEKNALDESVVSYLNQPLIKAVCFFLLIRVCTVSSHCNQNAKVDTLCHRCQFATPHRSETV